MSLNDPQVLGRDGPKEPTSWTRNAQCAVNHEAPQTNRDFLYWDIAPPFDQVLQSKQTYHVSTAGDMPRPDD